MRKITAKIIGLIMGIIAWFESITLGQIKTLFIRLVQELVAGCKIAAICLMVVKTFSCWISVEELKLSKHKYNELRTENPDLLIPVYLRHPKEVKTPASIEIDRRREMEHHTSTKTAEKGKKEKEKDKKPIKVRLTAKPEDSIQIQSIKTTDSIDIDKMLKKHLADTVVKKGFIKARKIPDTSQIYRK